MMIHMPWMGPPLPSSAGACMRIIGKICVQLADYHYILCIYIYRAFT